MSNTSSPPQLDSIISTQCFTVYRTQASRINFMLAAALNILLAVLSIILNLSVSIAFIKLKKYKKLSDVLLLTLAGIHLIGGLFHLPLMAVFYIGLDDLSCFQFYLTEAVGYAVILVSFANILSISFDLYMNIIKPMSADRIKKRIFLTPMGSLCIVLTVTTFIFQVAMRRYNSYFRIASGLFVFLTYIFAIAVQFKVYHETIQLKFRDSSLSGGGGHKDIKKALRRICRVTKAIVIIYSICYIPYIGLVFYDDILNEERTAFINTYVKCWVFCFSSLIHVSNPIVYCLRMKSVRQKTLQLLQFPFGGQFHRRSESQPQQTTLPSTVDAATIHNLYISTQ